ncbi:YciI family protein [Parvularcula lutaonensis]|uniref:YciI family protein n=1 Tax=Parvularcula lutaonensis TaxID=491923 RepID=A0ABV7MAX6_9PROT|nr:YciI family protein [Parvularcula lutaonensis]GGY38738.1 hypothetical protein GCM10007148_03830 [Parvularcula lutaonensis]
MPATEPPYVERLKQKCFLVTCRDGDDSARLRTENLAGHLEHVERHWQRYVTAGPIREPGQEALCGSVFLVLADDLDDAKELMNGDPYITSGLYRSIEYHEFSNSIGQFIGGKIWKDVQSIAHRAAGGPT